MQGGPGSDRSGGARPRAASHCDRHQRGKHAEAAGDREGEQIAAGLLADQPRAERGGGAPSW